MAQRQKKEAVEDTKPKKSSASKGASKKAYYARGADTLARNKARRAKRVSRRKAYWATPEGQARKAAKMNTPEKLEKREKWRLARNARRVERQKEKQLAPTQETK